MKLYYDLNLQNEPRQVIRYSQAIPPKIYQTLQGFARYHGLTTYHCMLGTLYILFSRLTNTHTFVLGLPLLNRSGKSLKDTVGVLINILPFIFEDYTSHTVLELLQAIKKQLSADYRHHRFTAFNLREKLNYSSRNTDRLQCGEDYF